jgi:hypothetical protein
MRRGGRRKRPKGRKWRRESLTQCPPRVEADLGAGVRNGWKGDIASYVGQLLAFLMGKAAKGHQDGMRWLDLSR